MTIDRISLGRSGEEEAVRVLKKSGYRILERNYRCRYGEIDLIASHEGAIVFIEVKTRSGGAFGTPKCSVDFRKQKHIVAASSDYLQRHGLDDQAVRFDVVSIELKSGRLETEVVKNAFDAGQW